MMMTEKEKGRRYLETLNDIIEICVERYNIALEDHGDEQITKESYAAFKSYSDFIEGLRIVHKEFTDQYQVLGRIELYDTYKVNQILEKIPGLEDQKKMLEDIMYGEEETAVEEQSMFDKIMVSFKKLGEEIMAAVTAVAETVVTTVKKIYKSVVRTVADTTDKLYSFFSLSSLQGTAAPLFFISLCS